MCGGGRKHKAGKPGPSRERPCPGFHPALAPSVQVFAEELRAHQTLKYVQIPSESSRLFFSSKTK